MNNKEFAGLQEAVIAQGQAMLVVQYRLDIVTELALGLLAELAKTSETKSGRVSRRVRARAEAWMQSRQVHTEAEAQEAMLTLVNDIVEAAREDD